MGAKIIKRLIFTSIIILMVIAAHFPHGRLIYQMHTIGLDIPMTPFTADMTLMLAKKNKSAAYYQNNFQIRYKSARGTNTIKAEHLGWYEFKAPFQWMSECREGGRECPFVLYYLCRSLEDYTKTLIISWIPEATNSAENDTSSGLGVEYRCPIK